MWSQSQKGIQTRARAFISPLLSSVFPGLTYYKIKIMKNRQAQYGPNNYMYMYCCLFFFSTHPSMHMYVRTFAVFSRSAFESWVAVIGGRTPTLYVTARSANIYNCVTTLMRLLMRDLHSSRITGKHKKQMPRCESLPHNSQKLGRIWPWSCCSCKAVIFLPHLHDIVHAADFGCNCLDPSLISNNEP